MANVVVQDLVKVYDNDVEAVKGIDFEVHDGEFVVIVGPSGCGKSSTLRMIAGLETITGGTVQIGDEVVNDVPPKHRNIAMVFQNYALYPHMSAYQNLAFGLKMRKVPKDQIDRRVRDAAGILGIEDILDRKPKQLSGGQRQRVAVGRAIVRDPAVFLFDEPLSNLDAKLRVQMRTEISKLHQRLQATMIYVTHDQVEAMTMGDRIVVMDVGEIQQIDTPLNIYNRPANRFVAGFIGNTPMNFLEGRVTAGESPVFEDVSGTVRLPLDASPWDPSNLEHDEVSIGFRPEDLYLVSGRHTPDRTAVIHLNLDVLEPMGNEIVLYLKDPAEGANGPVDESTSGDSRIIARIAPEVVPEVGSRLEIAVDLTRLHVFDGRTGERL